MKLKRVFFLLLLFVSSIQTKPENQAEKENVLHVTSAQPLTTGMRVVYGLSLYVGMHIGMYSATLCLLYEQIYKPNIPQRLCAWGICSILRRYVSKTVENLVTQCSGCSIYSGENSLGVCDVARLTDCALYLFVLKRTENHRFGMF